MTPPNKLLARARLREYGRQRPGSDTDTGPVVCRDTGPGLQLRGRLGRGQDVGDIRRLLPWARSVCSRWSS